MVELYENAIYFLISVIGICLKPHFYKKSQQFQNPKTDFSLTSANKPKSSLVLYLQV